MERGGSVYDHPEVFERYVRKRDASAFDPNHVMEEPAVLAELGDPIGRRVVDLGCGDGAFGAMLLAAGAAGYLGIDGSRTMVEQAPGHHRPRLLHAGLTLTALRECEPVPARFANEPGELARRRRVPLYLLLRGDRPA